MSAASSDKAYHLFRNELLHLTKESRKIIGHLTTIADNNIAHCESISAALCDHLNSVNHPMLMPAIYLIDSLSKNLVCYRDILTPKIVGIFAKSFESANHAVRGELVALRQTWNTTFDSYTLYNLDREIERLTKRNGPQRPRRSLTDLKQKTKTLLGAPKPKIVPFEIELNWPYDTTTTTTTTTTNPANLPENGKSNRKRPSDDHCVLVDGQAIPIQPNQRTQLSLSPRKLNGRRHEVVCDTIDRCIRVNSQIAHKFDSVSSSVFVLDQTTELSIGYFGPRISIWVDQLSFELRLDGPTEEIRFSDSDEILGVRVAGLDRRLLVNGIDVGRADPRSGPIFAENHEFRFAPRQREIIIDGNGYKMWYGYPKPCVEIAGRFYGIRFDCQNAREIRIDGIPHLVAFDRSCRVAFGERNSHQIAWGGPGFEVVIDGRPYELVFGGQQRSIYIGPQKHSIQLTGDVPAIKILGEMSFQGVRSTEQQTPPPPPPVMNPTSTNNSFDTIKFSECFAQLMGQIQVQPAQPFRLLAMPASSPTQIRPNPRALLENIMSQDQIVRYQTTPRMPPIQNHQYNRFPPPPPPPPPPPKIDDFDEDMVKTLYKGTPCQQCGVRFDLEGDDCPFMVNAKNPEKNRRRFDQHLDRHFHANKKAKEIVYSGLKPPRGWMIDQNDWFTQQFDSDPSRKVAVGFEKPELPDVIVVKEDLKRRGAYEDLFNDEREQSKTKKPRIAKVKPPMCAALADVDEFCRVCKEGFEQVFDRDMDEWMNVNAVRNENGVFHVICLPDFREEDDAAGIRAEQVEEEAAEETPVISLEELEKLINSMKRCKNDQATKQEPQQQQ